MKLTIKALCILLCLALLAGCQATDSTSGGFSGEAPTAGSSNIYSAAKGYTYKAGDVELLVELGIVSAEELAKGEYITTREALQVVRRILGYDEVGTVADHELSEWYVGDILAPMDYLDNSDKKLLLDLTWWGGNRETFLAADDIIGMDLDSNITEYAALTYITRMVQDSIGCVALQLESHCTEKNQTYSEAFEKGIIESADTENADLPMPRKDFLQVIHKAIFVEFTVATVGTTIVRHVDSIANREIVLPKDIHSNDVSVEYTINDGPSISWDLPDPCAGKTALYMEIELITQDGEITTYGSGDAQIELSAKDLINYTAAVYPKQLNYLRCKYYQYSSTAKEEWIFDIDVSSIKLVVQGAAVSPGTYTYSKNSWVPECITLADGELFEADAHYLLTSYEDTYRRSEYNKTSRAILRTDEVTNAFVYEGWQNDTETRFFEVDGRGGIYLDEIHIQKVTVKGDPESGFVLMITPPSDAFEVAESSEHKS